MSDWINEAITKGWNHRNERDAMHDKWVGIFDKWKDLGYNAEEMNRIAYGLLVSIKREVDIPIVQLWLADWNDEGREVPK